MTEQQARLLKLCPACGQEKSHGENACIVCWDCFKYRENFPVFKYWDGSFKDWLQAAKQSLSV